jgi:hypothetical protein
MAESETDKKADFLVRTGWEGHVFGKYKMGRNLLERRWGQRINIRE